jgi:DNA polymerase
MSKIDEINARYMEALGQYRPFVLGTGDESARLLLVGEAPGAHEVEQGRPFVGAAGKNLDGFLAQMKIPRDSIYITNAVKMRPSKISAKGRLSNRPPTAKEARLFQGWLQEEIRAVVPRVIATLGNVALCSVTGRKLFIGDVHGRPLAHGEIIVFPLYHPAAIIYRRELASVFAEDVDRLRACCDGQRIFCRG